MGILDELLSGMAGQAPGGRAPRQQMRAAGGGAGITSEEASHGLSQLLPEVVDRVTPDGKVPDANALTNSVDDFVRRLGLS